MELSENVICRKTLDDLIKKKFNSSPPFSIVIATYNESENIVNLLHQIQNCTVETESYEIVIVDDNSPDDTVGSIIKAFGGKNGFTVYKIREYIGLQSHQYYLIYPQMGSRFYIKVIKRKERSGLISALYEGFKSSIGEYLIVMDADFSHSPDHINKLIKEIRISNCDLVIASRYLRGGRIVGWTAKRIFLSKFATNLSKLMFGLSSVTDPMSGFFIIKRDAVRKMHFNTDGFKILLEILVKSKNLKIREVPYTFSDRALGSSKLNSKVTIDFFKGLYTLYKYN
jgi:dolichol-phosphate mannosyltransferase